MPIKESKLIWFNGKMIPWHEAKVHVLSHAIHYGSSVFEGIRAYKSDKGLVIFRLGTHIERLYESARIYRMDMPFDQAAVSKACNDVLIQNNLMQGAYLRPVAFKGYGELGICPPGKIPTDMAVAAMEWGAYLGEDGLNKGVDVCISSWNRIAPNTLPTIAKAGGNYLSSILISSEAKRNGFAEGIALSVDGMVSEGAGENIFVIRKGVMYTPPIGAAILAGITRESIMQLARDAGIEVREQSIPRELLYLADEIFLTGTACEVTPVRSVDKMEIGNGGRGPITEKIQSAFFGLFSGKTKDKYGWLDFVA